jgi:hypothetical protein
LGLELIYRITLLDNQKIANSLVSLLKAVPTLPELVRVCGAVFLLSRISGDDKSRYAVFSSNDLALDYQKSGKMFEACYAQEIP